MKIRISVALDPDLDERARESVGRSGKTLSEWFTEAAKARLLAVLGAEAGLQRRMHGLDRFLAEWQAEHGAFTDEVAETSRQMGLPWPPEPKGEQA